MLHKIPPLHCAIAEINRTFDSVEDKSLRSKLKSAR